MPSWSEQYQREGSLGKTLPRHEKGNKKAFVSFRFLLLIFAFTLLTAALLHISEAPPSPPWQVPRLQPQSSHGWLAAGLSQWSRNGGCIPDCRTGRKERRGKESLVQYLPSDLVSRIVAFFNPLFFPTALSRPVGLAADVALGQKTCSPLFFTWCFYPKGRGWG